MVFSLDNLSLSNSRLATFVKFYGDYKDFIGLNLVISSGLYGDKDLAMFSVFILLGDEYLSTLDGEFSLKKFSDIIYS
jgi:hypothetical protein